jgi:hypothetical protein
MHLRSRCPVSGSNVKNRLFKGEIEHDIKNHFFANRASDVGRYHSGLTVWQIIQPRT